MKLHKINTKQLLYVMKCGAGFSCYGFDVLHKKANRILDWLSSINATNGLQITAQIGTAEHFNQCSALIDAAIVTATSTGTRCPAELSPQLIGLEGCRVEVVTVYGEKKRFNVGKSTGPIPCHLEIHNAGSGGGMAADNEYKSVVVIKR